MLKPIFVLMFGAALSFSASAATTWTLQGKTYNVDTLSHMTVGPGTTQTSLRLSGGSALRVFYATVDLTNPNVDMRVTKASNRKVGLATLSAQASSYSTSDARYFIGVNADFFSNSAPVGSTIVDGEPYYLSNNGWAAWYMTENKVPGLAMAVFSGVVTDDANRTCILTAVNAARNENNLIIYTPRQGANTGTNMYGAEVSIKPLTPFKTVGKTTFTVTSAPETAGSMTIPSGGMVLSGHGLAKDFVMGLTQGSTITLDMSSNISDPGNITQMAGGMPVILYNGETLNTQTTLDHLTSLNPRTAIGYNADRTKLVILVVDGRTSTSVGVVSKVLADMMRAVGCTDAMNFDGGGSSELYSMDLGVLNSPSDGRERTVTDAVFAVATCPQDKEVAAIAFKQHKVTVPRYGYYTPTILAYNKYGVLIDTDLKGFRLSCPTELGEIINDGSCLFSTGTGYHALTAEYNGAKATVPVTIGSASPAMKYKNIIVDSFRDYTAEVVATVDGIEMPVANQALVWTSSDDAVATVDGDGLVHGLKDGDAVISGAVGDLNDSFAVSVQIPTNRYEALDYTPENWTVSQVSCSNVSVTANAEGGMDVNYTIKSKRGNTVTIKNLTTLRALPDSIRLVVNPGDADITKITFNVGHTGDRAVAVGVTPVLTPNAYNVVEVAVSEFVDVNDFGSYPIDFASVVFALNDAAGSTHAIHVKDLQAVYTAVAASGGVEDIPTPEAVREDSDVIYDLRGIRAADNAPAGLYINASGKKVIK